jgi:hypothetical protein
MRRFEQAELVATILLSISLCFVLGCRGQARERAVDVSPARPAQVPLPDWAPENPSEEFLRAAKVLKPLPKIGLTGLLAPIWTAAYEFFGTMSEEQVERLRETGVLRLPVQSLTQSQRSALEALMSANERSNKRDLRALWSKHGAAEDLSNVDVGFKLDTHMVSVRWWIQSPRDPDDEWTSGDHFATL